MSHNLTADETLDKSQEPLNSNARAGKREARTTWAEMRKAWQAYALLAPTFLMLIVFMYYPPVLGLIRSFYEWAPGTDATYVGLSNFRAYFAYPETVREVSNMGKLILFGLFSNMVVPFMMAEMIYSVRSMVAKGFYRLLIIIPMLTPGLVTILLWKHIYDPKFGPVHMLLKSIGLDMLAHNWLGEPSTALYAVMGVGFPWVSSIGTLIYLGGLAQISASIYDSCLLDGCTGLRRILRIDLPLVLGQVRLLAILAVIHGLTAFNTILVLTDGGPGFVTTVPGLTMYKRAFLTQQFGYGSAIGLMLFVIAMVLTLTVNRSVRPFSEDEAGR
jgi:ABC-type sugar transport system permease subunit